MFGTLFPDALQGGPLVAAAERFLEEHPGAPRQDVGHAAEGLQRIAEAVTEWADRETASQAQEDAFLEGAGALLGLVLLGALRGRHESADGKHLIRVGVHGFFDPFEAIEEALDSPQCHRSLAQAVDRAEAEATGRAGIGRLVPQILAELGRQRPELALVSHFSHTLELTGGISLDLAQALRATDDLNPQASMKAAAKLVSMLPGGSNAGGATEWSEAAEKIFPRILPPNFTPPAALSTPLFLRPLLGGQLCVGLLLRYEGRSRFVRTTELDAWKISQTDALTHALGNLSRLSGGATLTELSTPEGPLVMARTGDGMDAARLLLPNLFGVLEPSLGTRIRVAVPHRDALWACADDPAAVAALSQRIKDDFMRAPHGISDSVFGLDAGGLSPAGPTPAF